MFNLIQTFIRTIRGEISTKKLIKNGLKVGKNFNRQGHCIIDPPHCWLIEIGNNVTLATGVYILAHDASMKKKLNYAKIGKVIIGDNVFVGAYSIILPNVSIGNNVIIGCGSVITKDIPDNYVVAGNPGRIISTYEEYIKKQKKSMSEFPLFGEEFTTRGGISKEQKEEMKEKLQDGIGFVK